MKRALIILIIISILVPGLFKLLTGYFFGDDPYEYSLSAKTMFLGFKSVYSYPYPVMAFVYIPTLFFSAVFLIWYASILSMIVLLLASLAFYCMLRSLKISEYASMLGTLVFAFSPVLLSEIGWGGQAQLLSFTFSFFSIYLFMKNRSYAPYILIFLALLTEPYTAVFGTAALFLLILYTKKYQNIIYYFAGAGAAAILLFMMKSSAGIVIQPLILHLNISGFSTYYTLYFALLLAVTIFIIIAINKPLFYKTEEGRKYVPLFIIFSVPLLIYLFITPFTVPVRIAYFIMIPVAMLISVFVAINHKRSLRKYAVVVIAVIVVLVSYYGYFGALQFYQNPSYLDDAGSFISANSLQNQSFINVNIGSGWALESFSDREMYYAAADMSNMIYKQQVNNVLEGKIMSSSIQYLNSSSTYMLLNTMPDPLAIYTFHDYAFLDVLSLNANASNIDNVSIVSSSHALKEVLMPDVIMTVSGGNAIYANLSTDKSTMLVFNIENCTFSRLNTTALKINTANSVTMLLSFKGAEYSINTTSLTLSFTGTALLKLSTGEHFYEHSTDLLIKELNVKFAVLYSSVASLRFYNDANFVLAYRTHNILIFMAR